MKRKSEQIRIQIKRESIDKVIELIGAIAITLLVGIPMYYFENLPDLIPSHFDINGKPDAYSGKEIIWLLPAIGMIIHVCLCILNEFPHLFNFPVKISQENAVRQYRFATRFLRVLNTTIACLFCYITYSTIQTALGNQSGLGDSFHIYFIVLVLGSIGLYILKSVKDIPAGK